MSLEIHAPAGRHTWSRFHHVHLGKYAEYFARLEFLLLGCDVFTSEVDNHGIDFVVRTPVGDHYDVQVKSYRRGTARIHLPRVYPSLLLAVVQFIEGEPPALFLIHSWHLDSANPIFKTSDQKRQKWGLSLSKKTLAVLA